MQKNRKSKHTVLVHCGQPSYFGLIDANHIAICMYRWRGFMVDASNVFVNRQRFTCACPTSANNRRSVCIYIMVVIADTTPNGATRITSDETNV